MTATAIGSTDSRGRRLSADEREELRVSILPSPVRSQLLTNLRAAILTGALPPGQHLVERELMALTDVGRGTIREALRQLAAEGLVTTVPNLGSLVARLSLEQVERIYEVRIELESLLGRLFVERADSSQRAALVNALRAVERAAKNQRPMADANNSFHEILCAGADNEPLCSLAASMRARVQFFRSRSFIKPYHCERSVAGLQAIVRAVVRDDPAAAAKACAQHTKVECAAVLIAVAMWPGPNDATSAAPRRPESPRPESPRPRRSRARLGSAVRVAE